MVPQLARNWWTIALRGAAGVIFAIVAFAWPIHTMNFLVALFGAYVLIDGIIAIFAALNAAKKPDENHQERWLPGFAEGLAGVLLGLAALFWPSVAIVALVYFIGAWAIVTGLLTIYAAIRLRDIVSGEWMLLLSGIVSLVMGVVLVIMPRAGAVAFLWLIGVYALVFGLLLLALAFKLRGLDRQFHTHAPA